MHTDDTDTGPAPEVDEVYSASTFTVVLRSDEVYGQGQTHSNWNTSDPDGDGFPELDLYVPDNEDTQRPLVVFTHGGGWSGGDKAGTREAEFCNYFAERGFVCASLNYRLRGDKGTVPQAYFDAVRKMLVSQTKRLFKSSPCILLAEIAKLPCDGW